MSLTTTVKHEFVFVFVCVAEFEAKYLQLEKLGEGGFGSVYAGIRKTDNLPVAIKHIAKRYVTCQPVVSDLISCLIVVELVSLSFNCVMYVLLMLRAAGGPRSVGKSSAVTLVDWYDLNQETLLVMERPAPSVDLLTYMLNNNGPMDENTVKVCGHIFLGRVAIVMHSKGVFHRDIKSENILIETGSDVPRVRIIDFGCGCTVKNEPYRGFSGTSAYAPPEYFTRGAYEAAPTTVWQLGALLYELLDGYNQFITSEFLHKNITFNTGLSQGKSMMASTQHLNFGTNIVQSIPSVFQSRPYSLKHMTSDLVVVCRQHLRNSEKDFLVW
uniref:non-specific serine/threonine protein kinase n=1 Tax=Lates calcarifer TaxID=8187 RepID=A0A4W6DWC1_LATCA